MAPQCSFSKLALAAALALPGAAESVTNSSSTHLRGAARDAPQGIEAHPAPQPVGTANGYMQYFDANAFAPYGAVDIDTDATAPIGLTPQQCEQRCTVDSACMCVTQERSTGKCFKRAACDPNHWTSDYNKGYNVYLKQNSPPQPPAGNFKLLVLNHLEKCLDVKDHKDYNGNRIQIWDCSASNKDQYWSADVSATSSIDSKLKWATHQGKCLDVKDHRTSIGTPLQLWDCMNGNFDQYFYLDGAGRPASASNIPAPVGLLRWKAHPSKCVVPDNNGATNGARVFLTDCQTGNSAQYWAMSGNER